MGVPAHLEIPAFIHSILGSPVGRFKQGVAWWWGVGTGHSSGSKTFPEDAPELW